MNSQRGFTLLELMIAMAIFAALALLGWQVFDSVNRARERAQLHANDLAVLQYAYLQLQQDIGQIVAYQAPSDLNASLEVNNSNTSNNTAPSSTNPQANEQKVATPKPFMRLNSEQISFVRFADPDPRYQTSPSLQRIEYVFSDQSLIRRQYTSMDEASVGLDSVMLAGATEGRWQAYLSQVSPTFPNKEAGSTNGFGSAFADSSAFAQANGSAVENAKLVLLPNGVSVSFSYKEMPITWQFALAPQAVANNSNKLNNKSNNATNNNNSSNSNNNDANNNVNNNASGNSPAQNSPTVQ